MDFTLTPEQLDLQARAEKLGRFFRDKARMWDESDEAPYGEIFDRVGEAGLFGVAMPEEYGGQGRRRGRVPDRRRGAVPPRAVVAAPRAGVLHERPGAVDAAARRRRRSRRSTCTTSSPAGAPATSR